MKSNHHGFQNKYLTVLTRDGENDLLIDPLVFIAADGTKYRAAIGSTTDGLSTPKLVRILPGYDATGDDWLSGAFHDSFYRQTAEIELPNGIWCSANVTRKEADDLMLDAMQTQGVGWIRRHVIWAAIRLFGASAWRKGHH